MTRKKAASQFQGELFPQDSPINTSDENGETSDTPSSRLYAIVKPEMLLWGRQYAYLSLEEAAQRIGISIEKLQEWERGVTSPTINQLHRVAHVYKQLFAVFFLSSPPKPASLPLKDFRRLPASGISTISHELASEIRIAIDRREIAVRIAEESGEEIQEFQLSASLEDNPVDISQLLRPYLFSDLHKIPKFTDRRNAFNFFRSRTERLGIFVFQASTVGVDEMRGFSLSDTFFPVIVVNRKDSLNGRIFSLFHELTHILLRISGLCEINPDITLPPEEQKLEVFCNKVAAEILMPSQNFIENSLNQMNIHQTNEFSDHFIESLSDLYGVSREAIVRKMLTLELVSREFYQAKRSQYQQEPKMHPNSEKSGGPVSPARKILSVAGKPYCNLIIGALSNNKITLNDASGYLNVRIKQINTVVQLMGI